MSNPILNITGLEKTFTRADRNLTIFKNLELQIASGEIVALVGPSGAGKSTLLQIAGLLDTPTNGTVMINGHNVSKASDAVRTRMRRDTIGFVYQFHNLQPEFSALENAAMALIIAGAKKRDAFRHASDILTGLRLSDRLHHRPGVLSGGEQQRVAIARALTAAPNLLLADEPTGNLDPETAAEVFHLLLSQVRSRGLGALIATHNPELARKMDRVLQLKNGRLEAV